MKKPSRKIHLKDEANFAFDKAGHEKSLDEREKASKASSPAPALTPNGPMRTMADKAVQKQQEAIREKLRNDRAQARERTR